MRKRGTEIPDFAIVSDLALIGLRAFFRSLVKYGTRPHFNSPRWRSPFWQTDHLSVHRGRHIPRRRGVRKRVHRREQPGDEFCWKKAGVASAHVGEMWCALDRESILHRPVIFVGVVTIDRRCEGYRRAGQFAGAIRVIADEGWDCAPQARSILDASTIFDRLREAEASPADGTWLIKDLVLDISTVSIWSAGASSG